MLVILTALISGTLFGIDFAGPHTKTGQGIGFLGYIRFLGLKLGSGDGRLRSSPRPSNCEGRKTQMPAW